MRKLIENPVYMTYDEMEKEFDGKWILVTKCNFTQCHELLGGFPVVVADSIYEGQKDGFYDRFWTSEYTPRIDLDFDYDSVPTFHFFFDSDIQEDLSDVARD